MNKQYGGNTDTMTDKAANQAKKVGGRVEGLAGSASQQARQMTGRAGAATDRVGGVAGNFKGAVDKSLKQQPLATLAVAALVGFVLGALWKS